MRPARTSTARSLRRWTSGRTGGGWTDPVRDLRKATGGGGGRRANRGGSDCSASWDRKREKERKKERERDNTVSVGQILVLGRQMDR